MVEWLTGVKRAPVVDLHVSHVIKVEVVDLGIVLAQRYSSLLSKTNELGVCWLLNHLDYRVVVWSVGSEEDAGDSCPPEGLP